MDMTLVAWLVDAVIGITILEGAVLALLHRLTGRGLAPQDYALNLLSGLSLMFALKAALARAPGGWVLLCVAAAGMLHAADLWRRWRRRSVSPS